MLVLHHRQLTLLILCRFNTQPDAHTPPLTQTLVTQEIIIITTIKNMKSDLDFFFSLREKIHTLFLKKGIIQNWHKQKETRGLDLAPQLLAFLQQVQSGMGCCIAFQGAVSSTSQWQTSFTWSDKDGLLWAVKEGQHYIRTWGSFTREEGSPDQNNPEFFSSREEVCYIVCLGRAGGSLLIHSLIIALRS